MKSELLVAAASANDAVSGTSKVKNAAAQTSSSASSWSWRTSVLSTWRSSSESPRASYVITVRRQNSKVAQSRMGSLADPYVIRYVFDLPLPFCSVFMFRLQLRLFEL
ncbi:uncharacterized protein [Miscanthus floridulus]|uniref:uncharacterized protein isoform X2 n=1 Tax=Miscanthus floridulus TaxID=154761 RepID=UPI00345AFBE4